MKNVKVVSVVLSFVMIVCAVLCVPILSASAFTKVSPDLFLDFEDSTGIASSTSVTYFTENNGELNGLANFGFDYVVDPENSDNMCVLSWNRVYNGYSIMLGTPGCDEGEENAFELKPSTTYTLKFKYKYQAGSSLLSYNSTKNGFVNNLRFEFYTGCQVAYSTEKPKKFMTTFGNYNVGALSDDKVVTFEPQPNFDYNAETNNTVPQTYTRSVLAEDTEWKTAEYTFTTEDDITNLDNMFLSLSAGNSSISGGGWNQTDVGQYIGVYFDDISLVSQTSVTAAEVIYDFKSNGRNDYAEAHQYWFSNSKTDVYGVGEYGSFIADDGMHFTSTVGGRFDGTAEWLHRVAIRDNDASLGTNNGLLKLEADTEYTVIVKYKPLNIEGDYSNFGIAVSVPGGNTYNGMTFGVTQHMIAVLKSKRFTEPCNEWQYMSVVLDGDKETVSGTQNAGAYVYLTATGSVANPATYLIESVKVLAVKKGASPVVLKRMVRGEIFDASIVKGGESLTPPPISEGETSFGWVNASGEYVTTAPSVSTTLNAAYPTNIYTFDNGMNDIYMPVATDLGLKLNVVDDPLSNNGNKALKMNCTQISGSTNNFCLGALLGANNEGFKVNGGSTYQITMDVYLESSNIKNGTNNRLGVWLVAKGGISHSGNKDSANYDVSGEFQAQIVGSEEAKNWVKVAFEYTPNADKVQSYPYLAISYKYGSREDADIDNAVVYFDNITITEKNATQNKGGSVMLDALGGTVDTVKLMVANGEQIKLPTPKKEGYLFSGWTTSLAMAQGTLTNNSANMNDAIAPKTIAVANGSETYYAIWTKKTVEYTFGSAEETVFQSALKTEEVTASNGKVSVGFSLYDEDGDGQYELKADQTPRTPSSYKVNLGYYDGSKDVFYNLREDVTYRITMKFKVDALQNDVAHINVGRCSQNGFAICKITGANQYGYDSFYAADSVTDGYITVTKEYTSKGIFNLALNGTSGSSGGVTSYKDALFVSVGYGRVYIKKITVEAVSYNPVLTEVKGGGKLKVDYVGNTVTAIPNDGYMLKPGSIKLKYTRHYFDAEKYGSYDYNKQEHLDVVTELNGYSQSVFKYVKSEFGNDTYQFVNPYSHNPNGMFITAEFVPVTEVSAGVVANSIRYEKVSGNQYQSAGLRFRGRVIDDKRITEVGFIVVPTELKKSINTLEFNQDGSINCVNAIKAVAYGNGINKQYEKGDGFTDYQVLIKDLTDKNGTIDMTATDFTVVIYVKYNDNGSTKYSYSDEVNASWDSVNTKYEKLKEV